MKQKNNSRFKQILKVLKKHKITKDQSPENIRSIFEELGPTYVKIGQILSTREDLIPIEYVNEFAKLKENVSSMPYEQIKEIIKNELGKKADDLVNISEVPLGSASIGQVHVALLNDQKVVIKVMRPNIYETVKEDVALLLKAIKYINLIPVNFVSIDLAQVVKEIWSSMEKEMDFTNEANNLSVMNETYKDILYIGFPKPFLEYTTSHVLVMEFVDGIKVTDKIALQEKGYDSHDICTKLVENYISQILDYGLYHADPHTGNMIIKEGKIYWLDLGMVGTFTKTDRQIFEKCIKAVVRKDAYDLKNTILLMITSKKPINHAALYQDIEMMLNKYASMEIANMDMGVLMSEFLVLMRRHAFILPESVSLLVRSCILMQKTIAVIDPSISLIEFYRNHLMDDEKLDFKNISTKYAREIYNSVTKSITIPSEISGLLRQMAKGEAELGINISNLDTLNETKQNNCSNIIVTSIICVNLLTASIIISALIIATRSVAVRVIAWILAIFMLGSSFFLTIILLISLYKRIKK